MNDILERINKVFQVVFEDKDLVVTGETDADQIPKWDSLQHINLLAMLEQEFHITFEIDEIISIENVGDMLSVIETKVK